MWTQVRSKHCFDFGYTKKVASMGICDYNERKEEKPKVRKPMEPERKS